MMRFALFIEVLFTEVHLKEGATLPSRRGRSSDARELERSLPTEFVWRTIDKNRRGHRKV
jgi:hypothetical protein